MNSEEINKIDEIDDIQELKRYLENNNLTKETYLAETDDKKKDEMKKKMIYIDERIRILDGSGPLYKYKDKD